MEDNRRFSIYIHHGGFMSEETNEYIGGQVHIWMNLMMNHWSRDFVLDHLAKDLHVNIKFVTFSFRRVTGCLCCCVFKARTAADFMDLGLLGCFDGHINLYVSSFGIGDRAVKFELPHDGDHPSLIAVDAKVLCPATNYCFRKKEGYLPIMFGADILSKHPMSSVLSSSATATDSKKRKTAPIIPPLIEEHGASSSRTVRRSARIAALLADSANHPDRNYELVGSGGSRSVFFCRKKNE
ncbi:uncharacterized protein LOC120013332 isoform X2 [Tripterygium wilfordii]|uniref:uncharacterized protein LOC120000238 isoform X2 n=1 Tax=Tripterygium wilfordii TaxID=458696 RepID=UPI0018F82033|nr:uncharacterized protein LOC120000238 isoform X2 [Tripterygium wilfordii]XP_038721040.1 uncharacterized protein LOC120013332 isoform X2 [Tripterygium wilfordii]